MPSIAYCKFPVPPVAVIEISPVAFPKHFIGSIFSVIISISEG